jgi:hypothetical protein
MSFPSLGSYVFRILILNSIILVVKNGISNQYLSFLLNIYKYWIFLKELLFVASFVNESLHFIISDDENCIKLLRFQYALRNFINSIFVFGDEIFQLFFINIYTLLQNLIIYSKHSTFTVITISLVKIVPFCVVCINNEITILY